MMVELQPSAEWLWGALVFGASCTLWYLGDRRYVKRKPYHDAVDTLTANTTAMQVDIQVLKTSVAVMTQSVASLSEAVKEATKHSQKMAESTAAIQADVAKLTGNWEAAWWLKHGAPPRVADCHCVEGK